MRSAPLLVTVLLALAAGGCASVATFDIAYQERGGFWDAAHELHLVQQPSRTPTALAGTLEVVGFDSFILDPHADGELSQAFAVDDATRVVKGGQPVSRDLLAPGVDVRVTYRPSSKHLTRVDLIELLEPADLGGP